MPGLVPGIHVFKTPQVEPDVDGRDKSGRDGKNFADDLPYGHADWADRNPDVVATRRSDGGDRHDPGLPTRGDDVCDRCPRCICQLPVETRRFRRAEAAAVAWVVGVGGLFGYHALYFLALRFAPPAEAGLLNYLWPLLIVLFSSLLPGERLASHHIIGAVLGLAGTVLLFAGNRGGSFTPGQIPGLAAAFVAAFVWATYSVMSRRLKSVTTDAVAGFCAATALLAAIVHGFVETTVW